MVAGMWANFVMLLVLILALFGFGEGWLKDCRLNAAKVGLLAAALLFGDVWQIRLTVIQISVLPLLLPLYFAIESMLSKNFKISISLSLLLGIVYAIWYTFVPLEPAFHLVNQEGWVGVLVGGIAAICTKNRVVLLGSVVCGVLIGTGMRYVVNQYMLTDLNPATFFDGVMRDELINAWLTAFVLFEVRQFFHGVVSVLRRRKQGIFLEGDIS